MSRRKTIRFGDYIQAMSIDSQKIPYQELMPEPLFDRHGNEHPQPVPKMKLGGGDILKILQPYLSTRFIDQARAVVPLAIYLALFQYLVLQTPVMDASIIAGGLFAVMIGLMMFMEGLKLGLMPFGEIIGNTLPRKLGGSMETVLNNKSGILYKFDDPRELAKNINSFMETDKLALNIMGRSEEHTSEL